MSSPSTTSPLSLSSLLLVTLSHPLHCPSLPSGPPFSPKRNSMVRYRRQSLTQTLALSLPFLTLYPQFNHTLYVLLCPASLLNTMFLRLVFFVECGRSLFIIVIQHPRAQILHHLFLHCPVGGRLGFQLFAIALRTFLHLSSVHAFLFG